MQPVLPTSSTSRPDRPSIAPIQTLHYNYQMMHPHQNLVPVPLQTVSPTFGKSASESDDEDTQSSDLTQNFFNPHSCVSQYSLVAKGRG